MITTRQVLFFVLLMLLVASTTAAAEKEKPTETAAPAPVVVYQAKVPIAVEGHDYDLLTIIMDFPTGAGVPKHFHGGPVLVTILSGEMTVKEQGNERIVKTGESWTEKPGAEHSVVNKGASVRLAVSMLLPKGGEATTLVK